jgi:hypothetical protein
LPEADQVLATLEGDGYERYLALDTLVATLLIAAEGGLRSIEVGVSGHEAPPEERARDFEQVLDVLERLGSVQDARDGRPLVGETRDDAIREFAGG